MTLLALGEERALQIFYAASMAVCEPVLHATRLAKAQVLNTSSPNRQIHAQLLGKDQRVDHIRDASAGEMMTFELGCSNRNLVLLGQSQALFDLGYWRFAKRGGKLLHERV